MTDAVAAGPPAATGESEPSTAAADPLAGEDPVTAVSPAAAGTVAGGCGSMSTPSSYAGAGGAATTAAGSSTGSECAPQPASAETTVASRGDSALPQAPNSSPSEPAMGSQNPQVPHRPGAWVAIGVSGPLSPEYHRSAASSRPSWDITRRRPRPSSKATDSTAG